MTSGYLRQPNAEVAVTTVPAGTSDRMISGARFALTEVTLGGMPGAGGTQSLARVVGERRAKELILTGRPLSAAEAPDWRLVNAIFFSR